MCFNHVKALSFDSQGTFKVIYITKILNILHRSLFMVMLTFLEIIDIFCMYINLAPIVNIG